MSRIKQGFSGLAVGALVLAACGGGGDGGSGGGTSSAEEPYVEALMASFEQDETLPLEESQVRCLAEGVVDVIGVDGFEKAGVSPADIEGGATLDSIETFTDEQASKFLDLLFEGECFDFNKVLADAFMEQGGGAMTEEQANCMADQFTKDDGFKDLFAAGLTGNEEVDPTAAMSNIFDVLSNCDIPLEAFMS
ncbi:MAG: hypothetical protein RL391_889 [Actinomycetota bacterium]|jgi:hypothetical protein